MIYILHFNTPYKHARHYVGFAESEETFRERIRQHRAGQGARLTQVLKENEIGFVVARIMDGDRTRERQIKNGKKTTGYCPICASMKKPVHTKAQLKELVLINQNLLEYGMEHQ